MSSRTTRATAQQFNVLLDFMREHPDFAFGRLSGQESDRMWDDLTYILNGQNGPEKTAAKWQRTWVDWKCSTRSKAGLLRSDRRRNGPIDGAATKLLSANLSPLEEQLLTFLEQLYPQDADYNRSSGHIQLHDQRQHDSSPCVDLEYEGSEDTVVAESDHMYERVGDLVHNRSNGHGHAFDHVWEHMEVKPQIVENDVGSTSQETTTTTKRLGKRATSPDTDDDSSNYTKRLTTILEGQQIHSAAVARVANALEQMVSMSSKRNDLEEKRLAIEERKIAVCERKALLNERKIAVEERRVAAEEHLLHCIRTYLQDKKLGELCLVSEQG